MINEEIIVHDISRERVRSVPLRLGGFEVFQQAGIVSMGIDDRPPCLSWGEGLSPTILFFWIRQGHVGVRSAHERIMARCGDLLIIPPCFGKELYTEEESLRALWLHALPSFHRQWAEAAGPSIRSSQTGNVLDALFEAMLWETSRRQQEGQDAYRLFAQLVLHYVRQEAAVQESPSQAELHERLARLWEKVSSSLDWPWDLESMARQVNMSVGHFHRSMVICYGVSPIKRLRQLRLERGAELLLSSNLSLEAIAERVGYGSAYAFSNAFYRYFKCRPGRYRSHPRTGHAQAP